MRHLKLPIGMSDFEEIRQNGYYYIDKSGLILDLLVWKAAKVTLITRPRRFGKTLGMSMLVHFYQILCYGISFFRKRCRVRKR